jgi:group I intron endonuclease
VAYGVVYLARNRINGKGYVGQTTQPPERRFCQHRTRLEWSRCKALAAAIAKYGPNAFEFVVLCEAADRSSLDAAEVAFILSLGTVAPAGYNLRAGGLTGTHAPDTRQKISAGNKGKKNSDAQRQKQRERMLGTSPSPETRAKIRAALLGRPLSGEVCRKMAASRVGKRHTAEARAKMSANRSGIPVSEETKQKLRLANLGKRHSAETKAQMSVSQAARWAACR